MALILLFVFKFRSNYTVNNIIDLGLMYASVLTKVYSGIQLKFYNRIVSSDKINYIRTPQYNVLILQNNSIISFSIHSVSSVVNIHRTLIFKCQHSSNAVIRLNIYIKKIKYYYL